jgi:transposase
LSSVAQRVSEVTVGVDTHLDQHVAVAVDRAGRILGSGSFPASPRGYAALLAWAQRLGPVAMVGVEGTGAYGAGLARFLGRQGVRVVEVDRPDRKLRRLQGNSDPIDAEAAARAVLSGRAAGVAKTRDAAVEMIRSLRVARRGAVKARTQALNQLHALVLTAPDRLRERLRGLPGVRLVPTCAGLRPGDLLNPMAAAKYALRCLARRCQSLTEEIGGLDTQLRALVTAAAPHLLLVPGVGIEVAGQLLVTAGDNPDRLHTEASFARLCGVAPLQASSGRTARHRLNRGGDRQANNALYTIALCRMRRDPRTRAYVTRRTAEGLSKPEIIRCLKRYIAREIYRLLTPTPSLQQATLHPA